MGGSKPYIFGRLLPILNMIMSSSNVLMNGCKMNGLMNGLIEMEVRKFRMNTYREC